jgi:ribosome-binding factor A
MRQRQRREGDGGPAGHRHQRLQQIIEEEIAALLRDEVVDPRLVGVIVTHVELSVDYKSARVGFVLSRGRPDTERDQVEKALAKASAFLRSRLAEAADLKAVPALRFGWDVLAAESPERP